MGVDRNLTKQHQDLFPYQTTSEPGDLQQIDAHFPGGSLSIDDAHIFENPKSGLNSELII